MSFRKSVIACATRGLFGFKHEGKFSLMYNHCDSWPNGGGYSLGVKLIKEVESIVAKDMVRKTLDRFQSLKIVTDIRPTFEEISNLKKYTEYQSDEEEQEQYTDDWYSLTYGCQGSFVKILNSGILYKDGIAKGNSPYDPDICFTYVLNFDNNTFDYYDLIGHETEGEVNLTPKCFPLKIDELPNWGEEKKK